MAPITCKILVQMIWNLHLHKTFSDKITHMGLSLFFPLLMRFRYIGTEHGMVYVLKFDFEDRKINILPYYVPTKVISGNYSFS